MIFIPLILILLPSSELPAAFYVLLHLKIWDECACYSYFKMHHSHSFLCLFLYYLHPPTTSHEIQCRIMCDCKSSYLSFIYL